MRNENTYLSPTTKGCNQLSNIKSIGLSPGAFSLLNTWFLNGWHSINNDALNKQNINLDKNITHRQLSSGLLNGDAK